ncbi:MAG TPA: cell division protein FtsB [Xanthomonadaceae bacterium]|nr:cell division protein FtsB [Xanthomonadaceae bacterium]
MLRLLALLLLLVLVWLQVRLWTGHGGVSEVGELERRVHAQRTENAALEERNEALAAEVEDLKQGEAAIEERARSELGMIKDGEVFYRVVEPMDMPADEASQADPEPRR